MSARPAHLGLAGAVGLAVALLATACSSGTGGGRMTVYSGRRKELVQPVLERFAEETGLVVDVRYGDSAELAARLEREGAASPADVLLTETPAPIVQLAAQGRLAALPSGVVELVDPRWRDPGGTWVGVSGQARRVVFNAHLIAPPDLPTTVASLVDARYRGQVGLAPEDDSFRDFVGAMRQQAGDPATTAWLEGLHDNRARAYRDDQAVVAAVERGEVAMGLVDHDDYERARAGHPEAAGDEHGFAPGDLGNLVLVSAAAALADAPHPDDALDLLEYLLSPDAQTFLVQEGFDYALAEDVAVPADRAPLEELGAPRAVLSALPDPATTARMIDASGLDSG